MANELHAKIVALLRTVRSKVRTDLGKTADAIISAVEEHKVVARGRRPPCVARFTSKLGANDRGTFVATADMSTRGDEIREKRLPKPKKTKKGDKKP